MQEGYAGFTVSLSNLESVTRYIDHQEEHHRKMDFATEWKLRWRNMASIWRNDRTEILSRPAKRDSDSQCTLTQPFHGGLPSGRAAHNAALIFACLSLANCLRKGCALASGLFRVRRSG